MPTRQHTMEPSTYFHGPAQGQPHTHTIIFLHGRDSNAREFAAELFESEASPSAADDDRTLPAQLPTALWVFPSAALLPSKRFGTELSQWFDMWDVADPEARSDIQQVGLQHSIQAVLAVIEEEEKPVPRNRIFLCGISQGFATAISLLLAEGQGGFAGLIGLCSWLPFSSQIEETLKAGSEDELLFTSLQQLYSSSGEGDARPRALRETPIFLAHATDDEVVPIGNGKRMKDLLLRLGFGVEWHEYEDGGHWVHEPQGVDDILGFVRTRL